MKKTFYEILWELCDHYGLVEEWKESGVLLHSNSRFAWSPLVNTVLGSDAEIVGKLKEDTKELEDYDKNLRSKTKTRKTYEEPIEWIDKFRDKFSSKNLGVTGKTTDIKTVTKKMNMFLEDYDYTQEEILGATDLYIKTLKNSGSINYVRGCGYFISKKIDGINQSDLAAYCELYRNGGDSKGYNSRTIL